MFNDLSNTTFNTFCLNDLSFTEMENTNKSAHESLLRLYEVAGVTSPMELANLLNESPQTVNNWAMRGVSKQGAINASEKIKGCDVNYILKGVPANALVAKQTRIEYQSESCDIPLLAAHASMGNGNENHDADLVIDVLRITKSWVSKTLNSVTRLNNLRFIHAIGDSMAPTFNDGDILLVDTGVNNVTSDSVYVLDAHNRLFIKRVRRRIDGTFEISSDNPSVKTVDVLNGNNEVMVKGRVVWVWNGKKV